MKRQALLLILGTSIGMSGCSSLTTKEIDQPVVIKSMKDNKWFWNNDDYETVLLTPERRQILIKYGRKGRQDVICSEAPSDIGLKIDTLIKATLKGEVPAKGSAEGGFNNQSNTANIALHSQLQSIKFMMAASHAVCNLYLNGAIEPKEYAEQIRNIMLNTMQMAATEMALFYKSMPNEEGVSSTTSADVSGQADMTKGAAGKTKTPAVASGGTTGAGMGSKETDSGDAPTDSLYKSYLNEIRKLPTTWDIKGVNPPLEPQ